MNKSSAFIHSRTENRTLKGADEQCRLSISLRETTGFSPWSFICCGVCLVLIISGCVSVSKRERGRARPGPQQKPVFSKIVVDAGHGGHDPGAVGKNGLKEKYVVLDVSKRLARILRRQGVDVVMTRASDVFVPLEKRVEIGNSSGARLFVSIHANANKAASLKGFEAYYVSQKAGDLKRALAASSFEASGLEESCFYASSSDLKTIVWEMIYASCRAESMGFARQISRSISRRLGLPILGVKSANFRVLKGSRIPAVLVETAFISNSAEEAMLRQSVFRQNLAEAIAAGILD